MKKNKFFRYSHAGKAIALFLVLVVALLAGCSDKMDERFAGKWIAVRASSSGVNMSAAEIFPKGLSIEFTSSSKANFNFDGKESAIKWSVDGDNVTLHDGDDEWKGTINGDFLEFKNASNLGVDIVFGREGTDAMDPMHSLSDAEKNMVGTWVSESVVDVLGTDMQVEGVATPDVLKLTFQPDRVLNVVHKGEAVGDMSWNLIDDKWDAPDAVGGTSIMYEVQEDGKLSVDVLVDSEFLYTVTCVQEK